MKKFGVAMCLILEAVLFVGMFGFLFTLAFDQFMEPVIHAGVSEQSVLIVGATLWTSVFVPLSIWAIKNMLDEVE